VTRARHRRKSGIASVFGTAPGQSPLDFQSGPLSQFAQLEIERLERTPIAARRHIDLNGPTFLAALTH
jgi:hypothetical protein